MRFGSVGLKCEDGGEKVFFGTVRNGIVRICESIPSNTKHPKSPQKRRGASGLFISGCQRTPLAGFAPTSQPVAFVIYCHSSLQRLVVLCDCRWFSLMVRWAVLLLIIPRWNPAQIHMNFSFCKRQFFFARFRRIGLFSRRQRRSFVGSWNVWDGTYRNVAIVGALRIGLLNKS